MVQNQHYISKVQTKPWEAPGRQLHYFDFATNRLCVEHAESLFAKDDLWSSELEMVFNKRFEMRFVDDVRKFIDSAGSHVRLTKDSFKAILLLHIFNVMRSMKTHLTISSIEEFSRFSDERVDQEIDAFIKPYEFLRIPLDPKYRMFFLELGFFHVPLNMIGTSEMDVGFAVPLHPYYALGIFPKGYDSRALNELIESSETLFLKLSVGMSGQKLVVHPDLVNEDKLIEKIITSRETNQKAAALVQKTSVNLRQRILAATNNLRPRP